MSPNQTEPPPRATDPSRTRLRAMLTTAWVRYRGASGPARTLDAAVAPLSFLIGYCVDGPHAGVAAALIAAVLLAGYRIARRGPVGMIALSAAFVGVCCLVVLATGRGRDFYLPDLIFCAVATVVFAVSVLTRRPVTLPICAKLRITPAVTDSAGLGVHRRITAAWLVFWLAHVLVLGPVYLTGHTIALGLLAFLIGKPSVVVMLALTWLWLRRNQLLKQDSRATRTDSAAPEAL